MVIFYCVSKKKTATYETKTVLFSANQLSHYALHSLSTYLVIMNNSKYVNRYMVDFFTSFRTSSLFNFLPPFR